MIGITGVESGHEGPVGFELVLWMPQGAPLARQPWVVERSRFAVDREVDWEREGGNQFAVILCPLFPARRTSRRSRASPGGHFLQEMEYHAEGLMAGGDFVSIKSVNFRA